MGLWVLVEVIAVRLIPSRVVVDSFASWVDGRGVDEGEAIRSTPWGGACSAIQASKAQPRAEGLGDFKCRTMRLYVDRKRLYLLD